MLRTALTPRFLGLLVIVLVVGGAFVQLGRWQLGVAENRAAQEALEQARSAPAAELTSVLAPHTAFPGELSTRPVTVTGRYADGQLLVPQRRLDGVDGSWVLTPFVVDATGATLPVLRGFVRSTDEAGPPPEGPVTLAGGLAPPESPSSVPAGPGEIGSVDTSVLVNTWPGDLYNAFLFLEAEDPATGPQLTKVPTPLGPTGVNWRNAAYAVQWWVFAGFGLWLWWRMVREERVRTAGPGGGATAGAAPEGAPEGAPEPPGGPLARTGDNGVREHP